MEVKTSRFSCEAMDLPCLHWHEMQLFDVLRSDETLFRKKIPRAKRGILKKPVNQFAMTAESLSRISPANPSYEQINGRCPDDTLPAEYHYKPTQLLMLEAYPPQEELALLRV